MFKSTFSKYLIAFVAIILISFLMLSGIVTSMIRNYSTEEKRQELESSSSFIADLIADQIEATDVANILEFLETSVARSLVTSMIRLDPKVEIVILDETGRVLIHVDDPDVWSPNIDGAFVSINITALSPMDYRGDISMYSGDLGGYLSERSHPPYICFR